MSHAYHEALAGFHPDQILVDLCPECEYRGHDPARAIANLDSNNFRRAWLRAADLWATTPPSGQRAEYVSDAEQSLLSVLWAIQLKFENIWPLGTLPERTTNDRIREMNQAILDRWLR